MALPSEQVCHHYSLADLRLATQNFDQRLVIGEGGFGKVYKGYIKSENSSGIAAAIKRLDSKSGQGAPEFRTEVEMLSRLRHSNLVSILGCCVDGREMLLVYEYMPHGTPYHHLHKSETPLTWVQRLGIGIGAARGLDYLHTGVEIKHGIVHCDVKSSNILLDEDWAAKISDFGLAKICPINQASTYVSTRIKGTFGYLDPEFYMTGKLTRRTDVYAFGVVLFELLSGRHAVLPEGDEDLCLARWAKNCIRKGKFDQLVADEISGTLSPKSLKKFAQIAYRCLNSDLKERPTMSEVVVALQLSLASQEKFDKCAEPVSLFVFAWKMPNFFVLPTNKKSGHADKKSAQNNTRDSAGSSLLTENCGDYNEVLLDNEQILSQDIKIFSYTDLKCATRNFRNGTEVRWGPAYKGWVHEKTYSPSEVGVGLAITVTWLYGRHEWDLKVLSEFSHPNLRGVLGYCLENEQLYLVNEFIEKRSLKDYLREGSAVVLPLVMRVKVVVGVVRGLVFLHRKQLINKKWILETDDIWLDKDFNAKLIYFDLASLTNQLVRHRILGPTFQRTPCDVFGLGMLLMEILTGKPVFTKTHMHLLIEEHLSSNVTEMSDRMIRIMIDPRMRLHAHRAREILSLILELTKYHYTMDQALVELEQIYSRMTNR